MTRARKKFRMTVTEDVKPVSRSGLAPAQRGVTPSDPVACSLCHLACDQIGGGPLCHLACNQTVCP